MRQYWLAKKDLEEVFVITCFTHEPQFDLSEYHNCFYDVKRLRNFKEPEKLTREEKLKRYIDVLKRYVYEEFGCKRIFFHDRECL